jgi:hypothetical protein
MPPPAPRRAKFVVALLGYALTAAACVVGMTAVAIAWGAWAILTIAYLAWTGRAAEIRGRRFY